MGHMHDGQYITNRKRDTIMAEQVGRFMDAHFYSVLNEKWQRVYDINLQRRGVDVIFGDVNIDEKVKVKDGYLNSILEYPSFELSFINKRLKRQLGWFVDKDNITDYYAFIAVYTTAMDEYSITNSNIERLNVLLVRKIEIMEKVLGDGIDINEDIRKLSKTTEIERINHDGTGMHTKISLQFSEKPINLVVRRDILLGLKSTREFDVHKDFIEDITEKSIAQYGNLWYNTQH